MVGYAAVYGAESRDLGGFTETIQAGAFANVLAGEPDVRALLNHNPDEVLGRTRSGTLRLLDDVRGLRFELDLPDSPLGHNAREAVRRGDLDGASFRFVIGDEGWQGDRRTVKTVSELQDVSLATFAAYPAASVELRTRPESTTDDQEVRISDQTTEAGEDRTSESTTQDSDAGTSSGTLTVQSRNGQAEQRTSDHEFLEAMRAVPPGESRALTTAVAVSNPEISTAIYDRLRPRSVMLSTDLRELVTDSDSVQYPRITGDVVPEFYAEGAVIAPGDPTLDSITATPRKMAHLVQASNESLDDSDPSLTEVVRDHLVKVAAVRADTFILEGDGNAPNPRGLKNIAGIQTLDAATNGQSPTFDNFADGLALLEGVNVPPERIRIVAHPRNLATLRKAKASTAGTYLWGSPADPTAKTVFGIPFVTTPALSTNEVQGTSGAVTNSAYLFDIENVIFVRRREIAIDLDRSRLFNSDQSELRLTWRWDLISPSPNGIVRIKGLTA